MTLFASYRRQGCEHGKEEVVKWKLRGQWSSQTSKHLGTNGDQNCCGEPRLFAFWLLDNFFDQQSAEHRTAVVSRDLSRFGCWKNVFDQQSAEHRYGASTLTTMKAAITPYLLQKISA